MTDNTNIYICSTGIYLPEKIVTNQQLEAIIETSDEWIQTRSGIAQRRISQPHELTSDLAVHAADMAIQRADLSASDIDLIIVATASPDVPFPATACYVQAKLGLSHVPAFDISAVCSGFPYRLEVAAAMMKAGRYQHVLLIGAEKYSSLLNWEDRSTCFLFGDGAGAVILSQQKKGVGLRIVDSLLGAQGEHAGLLYIPAGGSACPATIDSAANKQHCIQMNGREVFKHAVKTMAQAVQTILNRNQLSIDDISLVVPHQANTRIIEALSKNLSLPMDRFFVNIHRYGNTSAASIPIALHEALLAQPLPENTYVLFVAFGAGLTWGCSLLKKECTV